MCSVEEILRQKQACGNEMNGGGVWGGAEGSFCGTPDPGCSDWGASPSARAAVYAVVGFPNIC